MAFLFDELYSDGDKMRPEDLSGSQRDTLIHCYKLGQVYMDYLPYTEQLNRIVAGYMSRTRTKIRPQDVHILLVKLRKNDETSDLVNGLVKRKAFVHPDWFQANLGFMWKLYKQVKDVHASDELPYTREFSDIYHEFVIGSAVPATPSEFYRSLVALRKGASGSLGGLIRAQLSPGYPN